MHAVGYRQLVTSPVPYLKILLSTTKIDFGKGKLFPSYTDSFEFVNKYMNRYKALEISRNAPITFCFWFSLVIISLIRSCTALLVEMPVRIMQKKEHCIFKVLGQSII